MPCFIPPRKTFDWLISFGKWAVGSCDPLDGNNSIIEHPPQIRAPKCANHHKLATLRLESVNYPIFQATYMQRSLKSLKVSKCWIEWSNWAQRPVLHETTKKHIHQNRHLWHSCKVYNEVATISWNQYPHMNSQHNKKHDHFFPLWHLLKHSNRLRIAWLMCLCVGIHVDFMFIFILTADEQVEWDLV